ncbi:TIGR00282 family metallophosphoesterase [Chloroflexota bacterium]
MRILMIGDVIGRPGRRAVRTLLPELRRKRSVDLVIANGENAAGGIGLSLATAEELFGCGVDVITSGNHIWHHKEIIPYLDGELPIIRPLNFPPGVPGRGHLVVGQVLLVNILGRTFMGHYDCPFRAMDSLLEELEPDPPLVVVDVHGEATSEKVALGFYLDGRVSAVFGTHTHVGTVDARVLPKGTAYISDVGMVGASLSVIGVEPESVVDRFLTMMPHRLPVGKGDLIFNSVLAEVDETSGKALAIERVDFEVKEQ